MIVKSINVNNLQLIQSINTTFDKINIISGKNLDNPSESGNGSGKSTLALRAILFALYGYVEEGLKLVDLIRFDEKECSVEIECSLNDEHYRIIRKIPTSLQVFKNDIEIQSNTITIKQKIIDDTFGDVNFFRQYRCVDNRNGINLLDMGIVSIRKNLMGFIEGIFTQIRTKLLAQKVEKERFSVDKKLYKHYLSVRRLDVLNNALDAINKDYQQLEKDKDIQMGIINQLKSDIYSKDKIINYKKEELERLKKGDCPILKEDKSA